MNHNSTLDSSHFFDPQHLLFRRSTLSSRFKVTLAFQKKCKYEALKISSKRVAGILAVNGTYLTPHSLIVILLQSASADNIPCLADCDLQAFCICL